MSTQIAINPIFEGAKLMDTNQARPTLQDRPDLQEIVSDILALKTLSKDSLFLTHKSQREILSKLKPYELAIVARAVAGQKP